MPFSLNLEASFARFFQSHFGLLPPTHPSRKLVCLECCTTLPPSSSETELVPKQFHIRNGCSWRVLCGCSALQLFWIFCPGVHGSMLPSTVVLGASSHLLIRQKMSSTSGSGYCSMSHANFSVILKSPYIYSLPSGLSRGTIGVAQSLSLTGDRIPFRHIQPSSAAALPCNAFGSKCGF